MSTTKENCVALINGTGELRPHLTVLRMLINDHRGALAGRDPDALIAAITAAEVALSSIARSQLKGSVANNSFLLEATTAPVPVYT